jgi:broad specificity phosphatase PhoE
MPGPVIWLARHGETEWSAEWRHTSWTDLPLTAKGEKEALALGNLLRGHQFELVQASPRVRALRTAELAGFKPEVDDDLVEWDYGDLEGLTTAQIEVNYPGWSIWDGPWPGGETPSQVAARADRVVKRARALPSGSKALLFAHGHLLRVLAARWLHQPATTGRLLALVTGTVSVLGWERGSPVVQHWSVPPDGVLPGEHAGSLTR